MHKFLYMIFMGIFVLSFEARGDSDDDDQEDRPLLASVTAESNMTSGETKSQAQEQSQEQPQEQISPEDKHKAYAHIPYDSLEFKLPYDEPQTRTVPPNSPGDWSAIYRGFYETVIHTPGFVALYGGQRGTTIAAGVGFVGNDEQSTFIRLGVEMSQKEFERQLLQGNFYYKIEIIAGEGSVEPEKNADSSCCVRFLKKYFCCC